MSDVTPRIGIAWKDEPAPCWVKKSLERPTSSNIVFITIMNKYGDNGHPCRIPLRCVFVDDLIPSTSTRNVGHLYMLDIIVIIPFETPYDPKAFMSQLWSILSNAFSQSKNTSCPVMPARSKYSCTLLATNIACVVPLFFRKPNCS